MLMVTLCFILLFPFPSSFSTLTVGISSISHTGEMLLPCSVVGEQLNFVGCADGIVRCFSPFTLQFVTTLPRIHYLGQKSSHQSCGLVCGESQIPGHGGAHLYLWDISPLLIPFVLFSFLLFSTEFIPLSCTLSHPNGLS